MTKLDYASDGDEDQGKHLGVGEVVLDQCCSLDTGAVDEAEETQACRCKDPDRVLWRITIRKEWFQDVKGKRKTLYGSNTWSQYDALYPESDQRHHSNFQTHFECLCCHQIVQNYEEVSPIKKE